MLLKQAIQDGGNMSCSDSLFQGISEFIDMLISSKQSASFEVLCHY